MARENIGPEQMLNNLRNETRQNRELNNDIILRELNDKKERLHRIEMILQEPMMTQSELERLTTDTKQLQRTCANLEEKIRQNAPTDDKLTIYKTQANAIMKKKESKAEELKKLEAEKMVLERQM